MRPEITTIVLYMKDSGPGREGGFKAILIVLPSLVKTYYHE